MAYTASDTGGRAPAAQPPGEKVSVRGLVVAVAWALGLAVGLTALAIGHQVVAVVALVLAVMAPGLGLAWVSHSRRAAPDAPSGEPGSFAARWHGLHFSPR